MREPPPPKSAPPAPPLPGRAAAGTPQEASEHKDPDEHMHESRERHLASMSDSGVHYQQGVWSYGDYKANVDANTPHDCAAKCQADEGCLHWNFHVVPPLRPQVRFIRPQCRCTRLDL